MMKKYLQILIFTLLLQGILFNSTAQQHCSEILKTTTSTINVWDWRGQTWPTNIYSTLSGQINSITSPFYSIQGVNQDNYGNDNIHSFVTSVDKDNRPEDGWELITKNLGIAGSTPVGDGYVVFYNKYTAKLRVFFLITQLFSETLNNDAATGGTIKAYFYNDFNDILKYQSNLFTSYQAPLLPLDQLRRDISISTPNEFRNILPYWLYADIPVVYDPCTCQNKATIKIDCSLVNSGSVDIKINSLPYQSPIQAGQNNNATVNKSTDFLQGFTSFAGLVQGGVKAATTSGEAFGKLNDAIAKQTTLDIQKKMNLNTHLADLNTAVNTIGNWASLIPVAGTYVSSVVSLVDYFSGGGKAAASGGPAPMMIMNDFKATGTISSADAKNYVAFPLPGSDQTGVSPAVFPIYNNILGSFNLLYTPSVTVKTTFSYTQIGQNHERFFDVNKKYWINVGSPIKFAINPALNIDLSKSSIKAAYIIEGPVYGAFTYATATNLQSDIEQSGVAVYRSSYFPINSVSEGVGFIHYNHTYQHISFLPSDKPFGAKIYLKVIAKLHPMGATNPSQDIYFITKYPVSVTTTTTTLPFAGGMEDLLEDITIPDNSIISSHNVNALNTITASSFTPNMSPNFYPNLLSLAAGESITLKAGAVITPNIAVMVGSQYIYSASAPTLQSLKATSAELISFCGGSAYNTTSRNNPSARVGATPEEIEVLTEKEFFTFYPNPAMSQVTFKYFIEEPSSVTLNILDLSGKIIGQLIDGYKEMGDYTYSFDTSVLPAGLYVIKFESNKLNRTEKLVVIK